MFASRLRPGRSCDEVCCGVAWWSGAGSGTRRHAAPTPARCGHRCPCAGQEGVPAPPISAPGQAALAGARRSPRAPLLPRAVRSLPAFLPDGGDSRRAQSGLALAAFLLPLSIHLCSASTVVAVSAPSLALPAAAPCRTPLCRICSSAPPLCTPHPSLRAAMTEPLTPFGNALAGALGGE
jgi:hypothetical protein